MLHWVSGSWFLPKQPGFQTVISAKRSLLEACHTPEFHSGLSRVGFLKRRVHVSTIERGDIKSPSRLMQISICERRCVENYRALSRTGSTYLLELENQRQSCFLKKRFGVLCECRKITEWILPYSSCVSCRRASSNPWAFLHKSLHCPLKHVHCASEFPTKLFFSLYFQLSPMSYDLT